MLLCTSGTAAVNFHPAVVEADLSAVPMIVVTADRPPELRDVGAPQTIDQTHLFGNAVRWFHDPGVADAALAGTWRSLARRVIEAAATGPVHLNLPFRDPLVGRPGELPPRRGGRRVDGAREAAHPPLRRCHRRTRSGAGSDPRRRSQRCRCRRRGRARRGNPVAGARRPDVGRTRPFGHGDGVRRAAPAPRVRRRPHAARCRARRPAGRLEVAGRMDRPVRRDRRTGRRPGGDRPRPRRRRPPRSPRLAGAGGQAERRDRHPVAGPLAVRRRAGRAGDRAGARRPGRAHRAGGGPDRRPRRCRRTPS